VTLPTVVLYCVKVVASAVRPSDVMVTLVIAVEEIEGISGEFKAATLAEMDFADEAEVGGRVVGAGKSVAAVAGETIIVVVTVLIGVAADGSVDGASTAGGDNAGEFPVVEDVAEEFVPAVEETRLGREGSDEAAALVGDTRSALGVGCIGILDGSGLAGDEGILAIVDGTGIGVGEAEIGAAGHAAVDGKSCAVVDAGGGALEFVDGAELCDGSAEGIDAGRKWASQ
jgi:hypothetical protein